MKILAIRGRNLASLAGDFIVDFQQEPLLSAGLFAITGATGAGKSTLLDALCLALYNKTPRLAQISRQNGVDLADITGHTLGIHETKNLLRRGATEGFAEVDFLGNNGQSYRATWRIWRAKKSATGALQEESLSLVELPSLQAVGHRKTEVLEAIEEKIGLSFEEFNRAVLLAQNEFFVFLKSGNNERAALLEKLTGSGHFSALSCQAYARAKTEKDTLTQLKIHLEQYAPLSASDFDALNITITAQQQQIQIQQNRCRQLQSQVAWHNTALELQQHIQLAEAAQQYAQQQLNETLPRQQQFIYIEAAQEARPLLQTLQQLEQHQHKKQKTKQHYELELTAVLNTERQLQQQFQQAQTLLVQRQQHYQQLRPSLEQAKKLDIQLESQLLPFQHSQTLFLTAYKNLSQSDYKGLSQWHEIKQLLVDARDNLSLSDSQQAVQQAQLAQQQCQQQLDYYQQELTSIDNQQLIDARKSIGQQQQSLQQLDKWWSWQQQLDSLAHEQELIVYQDNAISEQLQDIGQQREPLTIKLSQAKKLLDIATLACAQDVESLRQHLTDDSPCPVCGATEHPYVQQDSQLKQVLASLAAEVKTLQDESDRVYRRQVQLLAEQKLNQQQRQFNEQKIKQLKQQPPTEPVIHVDAWQLLSAEEKEPWLQKQLEQLAHQQQQLEQQETIQQRYQLNRDQAQTTLNASVLVERCALALRDFVVIADAKEKISQQRQQFFAGVAVAVIETQQEQQQLIAQQQLQQLQLELTQATQQRHHLEQTLSTERQQLAETEDALQQAQQALNQWLANFNHQYTQILNEQQLNTLLQHDLAWLKQEQHALQALKTAVDSTTAQLQARQQDALQHAQQGQQITNDKATIDNELLQQQQTLEQQQQQLGQYLLQQQQHYQRQQRSADISAQVEQQHIRAELWGKLSEVIGSSDGKKFRNAAQEITLDVLLFYTNGHLHDLAKRYRLERVKQTLGLQVIDQDMGDEVRSVHSLSGGESFLVSLALALGLASLSSQRINVESLFIDEGFGSLDADTLRIAMDALDILQSQGRKVGVISHVAEMTERIPTQVQIKKRAGGKSDVTVIRV